MKQTNEREIKDIHNMCYELEKQELTTLKELTEKIIDVKLLSLVPEASLGEMDVKEKLFIMNYLAEGKGKKPIGKKLVPKAFKIMKKKQ